jgi:hypothetical protein
VSDVLEQRRADDRFDQQPVRRAKQRLRVW